MGLRSTVMRAAKEWNLRPSELGICTVDDDLAYMVAYLRTETRMTAWEMQEAERETKRKK